MKKYIAVGGALVAAALAALAIAVWPASETDKARSDGERLGAAVNQLYAAGDSFEVDAALAEIDAAVADTRSHAGDELAEQADDQADALARAADGFAGSVTTDDAWDYELYQAELDVALDDLTDNAGDFRGQGPEVQQAFWDGFASEVTA
ncbi:MAG TPA: hypothetical protein VFM58_11895 [Solirubrobacteraceae bacterium]|nr:hypothetical protein [Solirubrobacteraceae bacterium]